jgi:NADH:ubiquinone oxidoreductase subunit 2 (subunit N)
MGFFPKIITILFLTNQSILILSTILIFTSTVRLYFYIKIILYFIFSFSTFQPPSILNSNKSSTFILLSTLLTSTSTILFSSIIYLSI